MEDNYVLGEGPLGRWDGDQEICENIYNEQLEALLKKRLSDETWVEEEDEEVVRYFNM